MSNYNSTVDELIKEANENNIKAMVQLGVIYKNGEGVSKDLQKSAYWYRKANSSNKWPIGLSDVLCEINTSESINEMLDVLNRAAHIGDVNAFLRLGLLYKSGTYVKKDLQKSAYWYRKANMYDKWPIALSEVLQEINSNESLAEMIDTLTRSAIKNDINSVNRLAQLYSEGNIVEKDLKKAIEYYIQSNEIKNNLDNYERIWNLDTIESDYYVLKKLIAGIIENDSKSRKLLIKINKGERFGVEHIRILIDLLSVYNKDRNFINDLLFDLGTRPSITLLLSYIEGSKDIHDLYLLEKIFRTGTGVTRDVDKALNYYKEIPPEANIEYNYLQLLYSSYMLQPTDILINFIKDEFQERISCDKKDLIDYLYKLSKLPTVNLKKILSPIYYNKDNEYRFVDAFNELNDETRFKLFLSLPTLSLEVNLSQRAGLKLLEIFTKICDDAKVSYFLGCGSLIGAVRHKGYIPWDDDLDVFMTRDDVNKLRNILSTSDEYYIRDHYQLKYGWRYSKFELRSFHFFIDIFYIEESYYDDIDSFIKLRETIYYEKVKKFNTIKENSRFHYPDQFSSTAYLDSDRLDEINMIKKLFDEYTGKSTVGKNKDLFLPIDSIAYASTIHSVKNIKSDIVYPLKKIDYNGVETYIPNKPELFLSYFYKDISRMVKDFHTHYTHNEFFKENIVKFIKSDLNHNSRTVN